MAYSHMRRQLTTIINLFDWLAGSIDSQLIFSYQHFATGTSSSRLEQIFVAQLSRAPCTPSDIRKVIIDAVSVRIAPAIVVTASIIDSKTPVHDEDDDQHWLVLWRAVWSWPAPSAGPFFS